MHACLKLGWIACAIAESLLKRPLCLAGRPTLPIIDHQSTAFNKKTGNLAFHSAPIIQNGPNGEFSIADMNWDILNRVEADGTPFVTVSRRPLFPDQIFRLKDLQIAQTLIARISSDCRYSAASPCGV